ncbi:hypothetical protein [Nocardia jiangxiensis]|uniref:hypothetical protein n=1 Tax=Nocardia jiangxiensis TaxID=282685 RepID=UPI001C3F3F45|nr:hypothetical protein [Nocardia jiangxiensis]
MSASVVVMPEAESAPEPVSLPATTLVAIAVSAPEPVSLTMNVTAETTAESAPEPESEAETTTGPELAFGLLM